MSSARLLLVAGAMAAMGLAPVGTAGAWYGMHGPGWDWPTGIYTPGKARALARRQALREWWYAPLRGDMADDQPLGIHRDPGRPGDRYRPYRHWGDRHWR